MIKALAFVAMHTIDSGAELARLLIARQARLIAVDGAHGSGKSTLSEYLAHQLGALLVEVDHHLTKHQGTYLDHLDYAAIASKVDASTRCVLEGICMRQVAAIAGVEPDIHVYVKRVAKWGWADEDDLVVTRPVKEHLARLKRDAVLCTGLSDDAPLGLWEEVIRYHAKYRPQDKADFIFLRNES